MSYRKSKRLLAAVILLLAIAPNAARAQAGGGGNFLGGFLTWMQGTVVSTLSTLAIIVIGLILMVHRAHWVILIMAAVGIWIVNNPDTITGLLH